MRRRTLIQAATIQAAAGATLPATAMWAEADAVDVALVLAVDVSRSVDADEARLQREGYRRAITDPRVLDAIAGGMLGAIGLTYLEWAGWQFQTQTIPWTRITGAGDARGFAEAIAAMPAVSLRWTSISGAIRHAMELLDAVPFEPMRRVIDISGDGLNNSGEPVPEWRDRAVARGITINGLPIINDRPGFGWLPPGALADHYRDQVIGGPGAFLIVAEDFRSFDQAVLRKLIREIA